MLPESMRQNLWGKVSRNFGTTDEGVKKVALKLQDEGYGDEEIMQMIRLVWSAADARLQRSGSQAVRARWLQRER